MFRKEIYQHKQNQWLGNVHFNNPISYRILGILSLVFTITLILFLFFGTYTHRETATGHVVPEKGVISIMANDTGVVSHVYVKQGELVNSNTPLFEISKEKSSAGIGNIQRYLKERLAEQKTALEQDLKNSIITFNNSQQGNQDKLLLLEDEKEEIELQIKDTKLYNRKYKSIYSKMEKLFESNHVSVMDMQLQEANIFNNERELRSLTRQLLSNKRERQAVERILEQLPLDYAEQKNKIIHSIAEINKSVATNAANDSIIFHARQQGRISSILYKEGQSININDVVMSLLPENSHYQIQLLIPSQAIGFIAVGNKVVIRYQAYPYQKFGHQYGVVSQISKNILSANQASDIMGTRVQTPFYQVIVQPDQQYVSVYGQPEPLLAGMMLEADIMLEKRRLVEWIFEALYGLKEKYTRLGSTDPQIN